MAIIKNGKELLTLEDWQTHAGPKHHSQWVDGRSAKECARAWLEPSATGLPGDFLACLSSHADFSPLLTWEAEPEAKLPFDSFAGEPRNADLVLRGTDKNGALVIAVEAKADEPFGETVADAMEAALERLLTNARSNGLARIQQLAQALLGPRESQNEPPAAVLRYQLLTACAGALSEAKRQGSDRAVMLIQEFVTDATADRKHEQNQADLDHFLHRLSHGSIRKLDSGELVGPFKVPGKPLLDGVPALFIGKIRRNLRTPK